MSFMHIGAHTAASASQFIVNLNGSSQINTVGTFSATAGFNFTSGGNVQKVTSYSTNTIDIDTDWITPRVGFTAADYQVRGFAYSTTDTQTPSTSGSNAFEGNGPGDWFGLATTRQYRWSLSTPFQNEFATWSLRYEIRNITDTSQNVKTSQNDGSTAIIDDGEYGFFIEVGLE